MAKYLLIAGGCLLGLMVLSAAVSATAQDADPTRPLNYQSTEREQAVTGNLELRVQSIWYRGYQHEAKSAVVINGELYQEGDQLNGYRITAIEPDRVRVQAASQQLWLYVFQPQGIMSSRPSASQQEKPE